MFHRLDKKTEDLKETGTTFQREVREKALGYILAGLSLVAGLAWNEAIRALIDNVFPKGASGAVWAQLVYAFAVTIFVVMVSLYLTKLLKKEAEEKNKSENK